MSTFLEYREHSRRGWGTHSTDNRLTDEQIRTGAIQRIADACEKMAASYDQMRQDRDWQKEAKERERAHAKRLEHRVAGLRGYIKRLKRAGMTPGKEAK